MQARTIGPYRIEEKLGAGGMGEVYRAYDERLERRVAIKLIRPEALENAEANQRFLREARAVASLNHPSIVQIHDILESSGGTCIVMELVEGETLASRLRQGPLPIAQALPLAREIAEGLAEAHAQGVVHRDLKTANVMLTAPGRAAPGRAAPGRAAPGRAKILDFGLAKRPAHDDPELSSSAAGTVLGTYHAMSPEQAQGFPIDPRSDLFSLGTLLYEATTGSRPFRGATPLETLNRIVTYRQPPAREVNPEVPQALSELIDRLLEKDRSFRPQSAREVAETLAGLLSSRDAGSEPRGPGPQGGEGPDSAPTSGFDAATVAALRARDRDSSGAVVKTLLMSDLVNSTGLVEQLGDEGAAALFHDHDRLARDLLAVHGGEEIDKSDGFLLLFERPISAVVYAQAYHQLLEDLSRERGVRLASRVGIHVGEVVVQENTPQDVARGAKRREVEGLTKPLAARLMSLAQGGQTLISRGVYDMARRGAVGRDDPEGLRWVAHGSYRFQGVRDPIDVFEVSVEGRTPFLEHPASDKAEREAEASEVVRARRRRRAGWAAAALLLLLALALASRLIRKETEPLYVAVVQPEVVSATGTGDLALVVSGVRVALLRGLLSLEGTFSVAFDQVDAVAGTSAEVARAVAADEVITSELRCAGQGCRLVTSRVRGSDGRILSVDDFEVPADDLKLLTDSVVRSFRAIYPGRGLRRGLPDLEVRGPDYEEYLEVRSSFLRGQENTGLSQLLERLAAIERTSPRFPEAYVLEARIADHLFYMSRDPEDLGRGFTAVARARKLAPEDSEPLVQLFRLHLAGKELDPAAEVLDELARLEPGDPAVLAMRARLEEERGDVHEARALMQTAAQRHPSASYLYMLARLEYKQGELEAAASHLAESLDRFPGYLSSLSLLAQIELMKGTPEAVTLYEDLVSRSGGMQALWNLGTAYLVLQRYAEGASCLRRALELEPRHWGLTLSLAEAESLRGRDQEAERLYHRALELLEADVTAADSRTLMVRAQIQAHFGQRLAAAATTQEALQLGPDHPYVAYQAALVYAQIGEESSALVNTEKALKMGLGPRWFGLPWFDPLRSLPEFQALFKPPAGQPPEAPR